MTLDAARGLVYVPLGTPSNDFYGGRRPGANVFAESLVCLDAATGLRKWHFQIVHHGLWDYDNPSPPNLVTIQVDGRRVDAVVQLTKQGFAFVFDRVTGKPVWPIEERRVPPSDVQGEHAWPTQPFPTKPPAITEQGVTLDDAIDFTPALKAAAQTGAEEVSDRPGVHAAVAARHGAASGTDRRRQLGRRCVRSRRAACCSSRRPTRRTSRGWGSRTRLRRTRVRRKWTPSSRASATRTPSSGTACRCSSRPTATSWRSI